MSGSVVGVAVLLLLTVVGVIAVIVIGRKWHSKHQATQGIIKLYSFPNSYSLDCDVYYH